MTITAPERAYPAGLPASVFDTIGEPGAGDPIFALNDEFQRDTRACTANLGIGVYCDEHGRVPMLSAVRRAAQVLAEEGAGSGYLPIEGAPALREQVQQLVFGADHPAVKSGRVATLQTVGGSGALRVAGELLRQVMQVPGAWVSDPSWHNHHVLLEGAGLPVGTYPYFDPATGGLRFDAMLGALQQLPPRAVVVLHGCCHNPTGIDLSDDQWRVLAGLLRRRRLVPLLDLAYQGFGRGIEEDAFAARCFADEGLEFLVVQTFSKNFSLYAERVGSLSVVAATADRANSLLRHLKAIVSRHYFSPPAGGARLVVRVLQAPGLERQWRAELEAMRTRVDATRARLAMALVDAPTRAQWPGVATTRGMFAYPSLTAAQVDGLKRRHGVYLAPNGRLCIAALNEGNFAHVARAVTGG